MGKTLWFPCFVYKYVSAYELNTTYYITSLPTWYFDIGECYQLECDDGCPAQGVSEDDKEEPHGE